MPRCYIYDPDPRVESLMASQPDLGVERPQKKRGRFIFVLFLVRFKKISHLCSA